MDGVSQKEDVHQPRPSLTIDWEVYAAMLEESDLTMDQQKELIETLWSIVVMFVDMGFDLDPMAQICGETSDPLNDDPPDLLSLLKTTHSQNATKEDPWPDQ